MAEPRHLMSTAKIIKVVPNSCVTISLPFLMYCTMPRISNTRCKVKATVTAIMCQFYSFGSGVSTIWQSEPLFAHCSCLIKATMTV